MTNHLDGERIKGILFDLDGVLYVGEQAVEGAELDTLLHADQG